MVIPVAEKDLIKLPICVEYIINHLLTPLRNIYIISAIGKFPFTVMKGKTIHWIDERAFPFSAEEINETLLGKKCFFGHAFYYYQQLLKLYIFETIPDLLDNVLILDSDYVFTKDTDFLTKEGKAFLNLGYPFFWLLDTTDYPLKITHIHAKFAAELVPGWKPMHCYSGMLHHMLFNRKILSHLFSLVFKKHKIPFWQAFTNGLSPKKWNSASEYILYHHFALLNYPDKVVARHLTTCDVVFDASDQQIILPKMRKLYEDKRYQAVGCHAIINLRKRISMMDYIPQDLKEKLLASDSTAILMELDQGKLHLSEF